MGTFWLVDTETTGLYADKNQMIEVGMMAIDDDMRILSSDAFFIKHKEYTIDAKALKVNRIDLEWLTAWELLKVKLLIVYFNSCIKTSLKMTDLFLWGKIVVLTRVL